MHTLHNLSAADFRYRFQGESVDREGMLPAIAVEDRVGIVMGTGDEGLGAANFLLSCVIDFYDSLREYKDEFFEYPDFYTFQATTDLADYRMFDVYPDHKNVEVETGAEAILRAVTDRCISILLVPDRPQKKPGIEDITRRSAERTFDRVYLYNPSELLGDEGFEISVPRQPVADWFETTLDSMVNSPPKDNLQVRLDQQDRISQSYREISLEEAMGRLPKVNQIGD